MYRYTSSCSYRHLNTLELSVCLVPQAHIRTTAASITAMTGKSPPHQHPLKKLGDDMDVPSSRKLPGATAAPSKGLVKVCVWMRHEGM